jgi:UTP--glucose-1-phosphate uridylyltransferase
MAHCIRKAVFPVGGLGTRFLPATKAIPKEMLPVVDKPLIQYAVEEARAAGIEEFIFVTGRSKTAIEDHLDRSYELEATLGGRGKNGIVEALNSWMPKPGQIAYTRQQVPLGLGHAVWCARDLVGDEPFAVLLADELILSETACLKQMVEAHEQTDDIVVAVTEVPREQTSRYGVLDIARDDGRLITARGVVEKPEPAKAPSSVAIVGRYILPPGVFDHLGRIDRGAGNEIQLTDALAALIRDGHRFHGLRFEGQRFDCGDKVGLLHANIAFVLARSDLAGEMRKMLDAHGEDLARVGSAGRRRSAPRAA